MKTTEEILIEQNRQIIDLLTEIKETNRQMRNYHIYHGPKPVYVEHKPIVPDYQKEYAEAKANDKIRDMLKRSNDTSKSVK